MDIFTRAKISSKNGSEQDAETRSTISSTELLNTPFSSYRNSEPTPLIVARVISRTLLTITLIVSVLVLFTVYIQSKNVKCDYGLKGTRGTYLEPLVSESSEQNLQQQNVAQQQKQKFPISLKMSGKAGEILTATPNFNSGNVNCIIERKSANQIIASEPKNLTTPFGNLTTDPRLIHLTGEKLVFDCHSGDEVNRDKDKEVIIVTASREQFVDDKSPTQSQHEVEDEEKSITHEKEIDESDSVKRSKRSTIDTKQLTCSCTC